MRMYINLSLFIIGYILCGLTITFLGALATFGVGISIGAITPLIQKLIPNSVKHKKGIIGVGTICMFIVAWCYIIEPIVHR